MDYLFKTSDQFSVIADLRKPYTQIPPNVKQGGFVDSLRDYCIDQLTDTKKWPKGVEVYGKHKVLMIYRSCKQSLEILHKQANIFAACENNLPEDICFFREGRVWFSTITHEHFVFATLETLQDAEFFETLKEAK